MNIKSLLHFILLSHHYQDEYHKCYRFGKVHLCSRCLGIYPVLVVSLIISFNYQISTFLESIFIIIFPIPSTVDWVSTHAFNRESKNWIRSLTGIFLGISLGRVLYIHLLNPINPISLIYFFLFSVVISITYMIKFLNRYN